MIKPYKSNVFQLMGSNVYSNYHVSRDESRLAVNVWVGSPKMKSGRNRKQFVFNISDGYVKVPDSGMWNGKLVTWEYARPVKIFKRGPGKGFISVIAAMNYAVELHQKIT